MKRRETVEDGGVGGSAYPNVCSVLAGENGAQLQVWRNIKTQLRADMELVMQKSEAEAELEEEGEELGKGRRTKKKKWDICEADGETRGNITAF